jgi:hypothetical protein
MTDILVVSLPRDEVRARRVVEALHAHGLDFRWEQLEPGLADAAGTAQCVVLLWTRAAAQEEAFVAFAAKTFGRDQAIGAFLDRVSLPPSFRGITEVDLSRFKGRKDDLFLLDLLAAAKAKAAGIDPPPARGPIRRLFQRLALLLPTALFVLGLAANVLGVISIKDLLKHPSQAEARDWKKLTSGSCEDLRAFRDKYPDGFYSDQVTARLTNPERKTVMAWRPKTSPLEAYVPADDATPSPTLEKAREEASARLSGEAQAKCRKLVSINADRFVAAEAAPRTDGTRCAAVAGGQVCSIMADVTCRFDEKYDEVREICAAGAR